MEQYFQRYTSGTPLAIFRIVLGSLMFFSVCRAWSKGWIEDLYIKPAFFFTFYGFEFIKPLGPYTYVLFALCGVSALLVTIGLFYRLSIISLFLSFTYIELIDKSTYLNHYYFISMITLLMIFMPANVCYSLDARRNVQKHASQIPRWTADSIKLFVCIVYVFAGLAKVNSDWLLHAQPLRIWLPAKNDLPLLGPFLQQEWVAYAFSWLGCLYDLSIAFLLLGTRTRPFAFAAVVIFHVLTAILFPIGVFPYIMIGTALIFFPATFYESVIGYLKKTFSVANKHPASDRVYSFSKPARQIVVAILVLFFVAQLALPLRYLFYPGELFWTEEGYRFSWRVMLMEKAGYAQFTVQDQQGHRVTVNNTDFLTTLQEKMMASQPDMLLQYAHLLRDHFVAKGFIHPEVYVDSYVSLNGRMGKPLVSPDTNLAAEIESFNHKSWILPFKNEIKGF